MRRNEFYTDDIKTIREILDRAEVGYLGINTPEGQPRVVPVNFVRMGGDYKFSRRQAKARNTRV